MPRIKKANLADISKNKIVKDLGISMKATVENINKCVSDTPWRKHFRASMSMSIAG